MCVCVCGSTHRHISMATLIAIYSLSSLSQVTLTPRLSLTLSHSGFTLTPNLSTVMPPHTNAHVFLCLFLPQSGLLPGPSRDARQYPNRHA